MADFDVIHKTLVRYLGDESVVTIPEGITVIAQSAFESNTKLTRVIIPKGVRVIDARAFAHCCSLTSVVLPDSVTRILFMAFTQCTSLSDLRLPGKLRRIDDMAFCACRSLGDIFIPEEVNVIGNSAFTDCNSMKAFTVHPDNKFYQAIDGVLYSKNGEILVAYPSGKEAPSFEIPSGVVRTEVLSFQKNPHIQSIAFPDTVRAIYPGTFTGCSGLSAIYIHPSKLPILTKQSKSALCAGVRGCLRLRESRPFSEEEDGALSRIISEHLDILSEKFLELPSYIKYITQKRLIDTAAASEYLDRSENPECRAILLNYLGKNENIVDISQKYNL